MEAKFEVELVSSGPSTGSPNTTATTTAPGGDRRQRRRRRHCGPAALAKSKARAKAHQASLAMPFPPPPPPPLTSAQRLVKVVPWMTGLQSSFWQLDGQGNTEVNEEEDREGEREEYGKVYCIFCNVLQAQTCGATLVRLSRLRQSHEVQAEHNLYFMQGQR